MKKQVLTTKQVNNFLKKCVQDGTCIRWTGCYEDRGLYGRFFFQGCNRYAHRVAYMIFVGNIPDDMEIDHECVNSWCVNPAHLKAVTAYDNKRLMWHRIRQAMTRGIAR
jgi:hypothetical protein